MLSVDGGSQKHQKKLSPDQVFDRLTELFGDAADANVILDVGARSAWNLSDCIDRIVELNSLNAPDVKDQRIATAAPNNTQPKARSSPRHQAKTAVTANSAANIARQSVSLQRSHSESHSMAHALKCAPDTPEQPASTFSVRPSRLPFIPVPAEYADCLDVCRSGQPLIVCMRGAPGSGKSHLAGQLTAAARDLNIGLQPAVFGADDFFERPNGAYAYDPTQLSAAHEHCRQRVLQHAQAGRSPICVDNTHMQLWEMQPYVAIALQFGYAFRLLEPTTPWARSAGQLAQRNRHAVPKDKIARMLERYQTIGSAAELLRMTRQQFDRCGWSHLSQMKCSLPPLDASPEQPAPVAEAQPPVTTDRAIDSPAKLRSTVVDSPVMRKAADSVQSNLIDLLRKSEPPPPSLAPGDEQRPVSSEPAASGAGGQHRFGCRNENSAFAEIRSIFPAVPASTLWDLFVQCEYDGEWTMDILLKDESRVLEFSDMGASTSGAGRAAQVFVCRCDLPATASDALSSSSEEPGEATADEPAKAKPAPLSRRARTKLNRALTTELQQHINDAVRIGDEHYSAHTRFIRDMRYGPGEEAIEQAIQQPHYDAEAIATDFAPLENGQQASGDADAFVQQQPASDDDDSDDAGQTIAVSLGAELIGQLERSFGVETLSGDAAQTRVHIPKRLARELYALWLESMFNEQDEQQQRALQADQAFAEQLQQQQQADEERARRAEQRPPKLTSKQIVEMELAWAELRNQTTPNQWDAAGAGLAAELTQQRLNEAYPNIEPDTLREVLRLNDGQIERASEMLEQMTIDAGARSVSGGELLERARIEAERLSGAYRPAAAHKFQDPEQPPGVDDAEQLARQFEDCRSAGRYHTQMYTKCYRQARTACQNGDTDIALYYSRIANLHKDKGEHSNQRAANCIVEVHNFRNQNPDMLDLHYLYVKEAIECLDLFIDEHVERLRKLHRPYKSVMVITGRGLHSSRGYSTIKENTMQRLRDRRLKWAELNPGLLRVRLYPTTVMSDEL